VNPKDIPDISALVATLRNEKSLPTDFLQYRHIFRKYARFRNFDTKTLIHMANFMAIEPVTGLNTINNIIRISGYQIPVDGKYVGFFTRMMVARELNMLIKQLRTEDLSLWFEKIDDIDEEVFNKICFRRGIDIQNQTKLQEIEDLKLWLSISNQQNVPPSLLLMTRIHDFNYNSFKIDYNETQDEVLRRVSAPSIMLLDLLFSPKMMRTT
jgi:hypothetical protein